MSKSSVTVVVSKKSKPMPLDASDKAKVTVAADNEPDNTDKDSVIPDTPTEPLTKSRLLALYDTEPLPIINTVNSKTLAEVNDARAQLYQRQYERTKALYLAPTHIRPTYLIQSLKTQFIEYQRFSLAKQLDQRGIVNAETLDMIWQQIHVVDDLVADIVRLMPAQAPVGWQLTSGSRNHLKLPTIGRLRDSNSIADQASLNSYVLGHFGVMSYTFDRGYFIGHVLGYLFCCYYFAYLSISYGVTPLPPTTVPGYEYVSLDTPKMVRLLQSLDLHSKRRIYQLAVLCARLSEYRTDKRIEKLLIAEVNDFDKKLQQDHLDDLLYQGVMPENLDEMDQPDIDPNDDSNDNPNNNSGGTGFDV